MVQVTNKRNSWGQKIRDALLRILLARPLITFLVVVICVAFMYIQYLSMLVSVESGGASYFDLDALRESFRGNESFPGKRCHPTNIRDQYIEGENVWFNHSTGETNGGCPEYSVCVDDETIADGIGGVRCVPTWRCEHNLHQFVDGRNCFVHPTDPESGNHCCSSECYCNANISPLTYFHPDFCVCEHSK